jgi:pSer/pThr/pTyr-binding forkhead associated (FHA) protein
MTRDAPNLSSAPRILGYLHWLDQSGRTFELRVGSVVIGRRQTCHIIIADDRAVSGEHARFDIDMQGNVRLQVLSQTNPVVVGRTQLMHNETIILQHADLIQLSPTTRFSYYRVEK